MPIAELRKYKLSQSKQNDFSEFWKETLKISKSKQINEEIKQFGNLQYLNTMV